MLLNQLTQIDKGATPSEILKAAGLDWEVAKCQRLFKVKEELKEVKGKYSVVRLDTEEELDTCSDRWIPQQNKDVIELAYKVLKDENLWISRAGYLKGGKAIALTADWNQTEVNSRKEGDIVEAKLMLLNSHQVGIGHQVKIFWKRLVCLNGQVQRVKAKKIIGHTEEAVDLLKQSIGLLPDRFKAFQKAAEKFSDSPVDYLQAQTLLIKEFGDPQLPVSEQSQIVQTVLNLFSGEGKGSNLLTSYNTAWGLMNSLTEYYSHSKYSRSKDRLYSVIQGTGCQNTAKLESSLSRYLEARSKASQKVSVTAL